MAHRPTRGTDSAKPDGPDVAKPEKLETHAGSPRESVIVPSLRPDRATNFAEVAAKFATHAAGKISAELSCKLALDLVLNQITEQACLATGASGAAIALRGGEAIVCRGTTGTNAPELGTRLDISSGLSGACLRSGKIQRCDDAWNDDRANADLSRQLGVRSVVVYPLMRGEECLGILEILSPLPSAFGERDLQTLEALANRIVHYTEAAKEISVVPAEKTENAETENTSNTDASSVQEVSTSTRQAATEARSPLLKTAADYVVPSRRHGQFDWLTAVFSAILLALALMMGAAFSRRVGWIKLSTHRDTDHSAEHAAPSTFPAIAAHTDASAGNVAAGTTSSAEGKAASTAAQPVGKPGNATAPGSTLLVYEGGKEIFRTPPPVGHDVAPPSKAELISRVEPEYPAQALAQHIQGTVALRVHVGADGSVREIKVSHGNPLLAEAAVAAVRQWRFKPYVLSGQNKDMETEITLKFSLPDH